MQKKFKLNQFKKMLFASSIIFLAAAPFVHAKPTHTALVANAISSLDDVIPGYVTDVKNPAVKTITVINNSSQTIYPVVRVYDDKDKKEYRIYVGQSNSGDLKLGILGKETGKNKAIIAIPLKLWDAGRVEIFNIEPADPRNNKNSNAAIDQDPQSKNNGDLIYKSDLAVGFPLDAASQLVEYTFEKNGTVVDYDVSYVDHLYMPVAIEADTGTIGYMGNGISFEEMQKHLEAFNKGDFTDGYFANGKKIGWPIFYNPDIAGKYYKLPAGYNAFALNTATSSFGQDKKMLVTSDGSDENTIVDGIVNRWLGWVTHYNEAIPEGPAPYGGYYASHCGEDKFCQDFASTVTTIWTVAQNENPNFTPKQIIEKIIGYGYPGEFNHDHPFDPKNPDAFRDAVKSILRGVPYPFWNYPVTQWYPNPNATVNNQPNLNQKYNLNPIVWFVHQQLGMAGYGFSIDDDTGNVETPGNGFTIAVGGLDGLKNKTQYNPDTQQAVLLAPGWKSLESTNLGDCVLNLDNGTDCPVSLTPQSNQEATMNLSSDQGKLNLVISYKDQLPNGVYPLSIKSCEASGNINKNMCSSSVIHVDPNKQQFLILPPPDHTSNSGGDPTPPPAGDSKANLYLAPDWKSITGCGISAENNNGKAWAPALIGKDKCTVNLVGMNDKRASLQIELTTNGEVKSVTCLLADQTPCKAVPFVAPNAINIATPDGLYS